MTLLEIRKAVAHKKEAVQAQLVIKEQIQIAARNEQCQELVCAQFQECLCKNINKTKMYDHSNMLSIAKLIIEQSCVTGCDLFIVSGQSKRGLVMSFDYKEIRPFVFFSVSSKGYQAEFFNYDYLSSNIRREYGEIYHFSLNS